MGRGRVARCVAIGIALLPLAASAAPSALEVLRGGASDRGFERADRVRTLEFPLDHGPHPAFKHEWWYFTGHLQGRGGERFGFELTFFRVALAPPGASARTSGEARTEAKSEAQGESARDARADTPSRWRTRQIYVAHFAVTDVGRRRFHSTQRTARDALGLAGAQAAPLRVWVGDWSVAAQSSDWTLRAGDGAYRLSLQLHPLRAPVLNGDRGLSIKSSEPGSGSYYYSIPRIAVEGALLRGGDRLEVTGDAWLDREWGSGSLGSRESGWDWFALQLGDGSELMFYALRNEGGSRDIHSAGTWVDAQGAAHALTSSDVRIEVLDRWRSPDGARYPSRWRLRVASLGLDVNAVPVLADQELDTTPRYWEGDVEVSGSRGGKRVSGQGYVELVGYAGQ